MDNIQPSVTMLKQKKWRMLDYLLYKGFGAMGLSHVFASATRASGHLVSYIMENKIALQMQFQNVADLVLT